MNTILESYASRVTIDKNSNRSLTTREFETPDFEVLLMPFKTFLWRFFLVESLKACFILFLVEFINIFDKLKSFNPTLEPLEDILFSVGDSVRGKGLRIRFVRFDRLKRT